MFPNDLPVGLLLVPLDRIRSRSSAPAWARWCCRGQLVRAPPATCMCNLFLWLLPAVPWYNNNNNNNKILSTHPSSLFHHSHMYIMFCGCDLLQCMPWRWSDLAPMWPASTSPKAMPPRTVKNASTPSISHASPALTSHQASLKIQLRWRDRSIRPLDSEARQSSLDDYGQASNPRDRSPLHLDPDAILASALAVMRGGAPGPCRRITPGKDWVVRRKRFAQSMKNAAPESQVPIDAPASAPAPTPANECSPHPLAQPSTAASNESASATVPPAAPPAVPPVVMARRHFLSAHVPRSVPHTPTRVETPVPQTPTAAVASPDAAVYSPDTIAPPSRPYQMCGAGCSTASTAAGHASCGATSSQIKASQGTASSLTANGASRPPRASVASMYTADEFMSRSPPPTELMDAVAIVRAVTSAVPPLPPPSHAWMALRKDAVIRPSAAVCISIPPPHVQRLPPYVSPVNSSHHPHANTHTPTPPCCSVPVHTLQAHAMMPPRMRQAPIGLAWRGVVWRDTT